MPQISRFFGIVISMFFNDHNPPHFHSRYGEDEALISINDFTVIEGILPSRVLGLVIERASIHKAELMNDWELVKNYKSPIAIEPLS
jgi:hypothetical protein